MVLKTSKGVVVEFTFNRMPNKEMVNLEVLSSEKKARGMLPSNCLAVNRRGGAA